MRFTKTPFLILFVILISVGVTSAYAINITLGGTVDITQILNMMGNKITNVGTPTANTDAATKGYVDSGGSIAKNIEILDSSGDTGGYTSMAIGVDGFPVISYYSISAQSLRFIHCTTIDCLTHDTPLTLDSSANVGLFSSLAIGVDSFPVISYHDSTNNKLKFIHCTNIDCSSKDGSLILDDGGQYSSIMIAARGEPRIAHYDPSSNNGDLKFIFCSLQNCSDIGSNLKSTLDSSIQSNEGSHLAMSKNSDQPQIVYFDATDTRIRLVDCQNAGCQVTERDDFSPTSPFVHPGDFLTMVESSDGELVIAYRADFDIEIRSCTKTSTDICQGRAQLIMDKSGNSIGINIQLALGSDGFPIIAYHDTTIDVIKFIKCTSASCGTSHPPVIVDNGPNRVGSHISIATGIDGNPVMAYRDFDADDLKFVHCVDPRCLL